LIPLILLLYDIYKCIELNTFKSLNEEMYVEKNFSTYQIESFRMHLIKNGENPKKIKLKVAIFGAGGVGKTTLTNRYLTGVFQEKYKTTIGMDFYVKKISFKGNPISLQIWDFAGEEKFRFLLPSALKGAHGTIFMYDITRYNTLQELNEWIRVFRETNKKEGQIVHAVLLGGKKDLEDYRAVPKEEGEAFSLEKGLLNFMECSSKRGENVQEVFENLTKIIMRKKNIL